MKLAAGLTLSCLLLNVVPVAAQDAPASAPAQAAVPTAPAPAAPAPTTSASTAGDSEAPSSAHLPPPPPGKAQVVFFRTGAYMGAIYTVGVREDKTELGALSNQSYFVVTLDPGVHTFTSKTENTSRIKLELDPGETYYVRGTLSMGLIAAEVNLAPADAAMFDLHYPHLHARASKVAPDHDAATSKGPA